MWKRVLGHGHYIHDCIIIFTLWKFSTLVLTGGFSLNHDSKSPEIAAAESAGLRNTLTDLHLCRRARASNECSVYDTKQCDGDVPVMLELWGMQSISSLLSLPGRLWPGVVASDRVLSMGHIELNCVVMLNWIAWNRTDSGLCTYHLSAWNNFNLLHNFLWISFST